jgi:hypothetical protein
MRSKLLQIIQNWEQSGQGEGGNMLATRTMKSMTTLGISSYWTQPPRGLVCGQAVLPVHSRAEQDSCSESLRIFFISGSLLTVTNFCSEVFSFLTMMLQHQMHHRLQVQQVTHSTVIAECDWQELIVDLTTTAAQQQSLTTCSTLVTKYD